MPLPSLKSVAAAFLAAVVTALVLGSAVLFLGRDDNAPIQIVLPTPAGGDATGAVPSSAARAGVEVWVYVSGAVRVPGVYAMGPGDRVADAVAAAGGATADAELAAFNLARRVQDEAHYFVPRRGETPPPVSPPVAVQAPDPDCVPAGNGGGLLDLNTASASDLETLPGIGPVRAAGIVSYREQNGPFQSVEEIANVPGIGQAIYESVRDLVVACDGR